MRVRAHNDPIVATPRHGHVDDRPKVLYICHNHPQIMPGGAETYALELYHAMQRSEAFEPIFVARAGPPTSTWRPHPGTPWSAVNGDPNQYFLFTEGFDRFYISLGNKETYTRHLAEFLAAHKPDIVHVQHTMFIGVDLLRQVRNSLPHAPIVYTLHEYLPICHRDGQMLRTRNDEPCLEATPRRCHECFPEISPQAFFARKRFIQSHLSLVDLFVAPSRFLLERYVDWGIPRDKICFEEYGRAPAFPAPVLDADRRRTLGFFGQLNRFKGLTVLLEAMRILGRMESASSIRLRIHGANLELQPAEFQQRFRSLLDETRENVTLAGPYHHADLPRLMSGIDWVIVPSTWWENAPLVIQEAFAHGRPVICSDIGGMAEKVRDDVNGLHFRTGDPHSLAATILRAVESPGLWDRLRSRIPDVYDIDAHANRLSGLYRSLIADRRSQPAPLLAPLAGQASFS